MCYTVHAVVTYTDHMAWAGIVINGSSGVSDGLAEVIVGHQRLTWGSSGVTAVLRGGGNGVFM